MGRFINADSYASTGQGILGNNMFAYCGNNPISRLDPTGNVHVSVCPAAQFCSNGGYPPYALPDNTHNKVAGLINGQAICPYADERIMFGNYAKNGCGIIAIYNANQLLGYHKSLASIESFLLYNNGYVLGGLFGVYPFAIENYYISNGIPLEKHASYESLASNVTEGDIIIFLVFNNKDNILEGAHYMAAQYASGEYIVYNYHSKYPESKSFSSLSSPYGNSVFWCGYIVGGIT